MRTKLAIIAFCFLFALAVIPANADQWNKKTTVTFTGPVEIPGMVLQPGTYVFKLLNSYSNRNIVLVYNADETYLYKMILAIPNYRLFPKEEPVLHFTERGKGSPDAVKAWFFSGDNWGQEFVYPKAEAVALAETEQAPVLSAELKAEETPEELAEVPVETVEPVEVAEVAEVTPVEEPAPIVAPEYVAARPYLEELPHTAQNVVPVLIFMGVFALILGGVMKFSSRTH